MTQNVLSITGELRGIIWGALVLALFAIALSLRTRLKTSSGSRGHRLKRNEASQEHEVINPDGYIDSFAGDIEEAGGSFPPIVQAALPGILLWWLGYLLLNWTPR